MLKPASTARSLITPLLRVPATHGSTSAAALAGLIAALLAFVLDAEALRQGRSALLTLPTQVLAA
jgi:hypothetical protein